MVAFVQQYDPRAGSGTIIATMLPYSIALLLAWSALLAVWITFDIPLAPRGRLLRALSPGGRHHPPMACM